MKKPCENSDVEQRSRACCDEEGLGLAKLGGGKAGEARRRPESFEKMPALCVVLGIDCRGQNKKAVCRVRYSLFSVSHDRRRRVRGPAGQLPFRFFGSRSARSQKSKFR